MYKFKIQIISCALAVASCVTGSKVAVAEPVKKIRVGLITPLTGSVASFGVPVSRGAQLALKDLGPGSRIDLVTEDDSTCETKTAISAYHALKLKHNPQVYITFCSAAGKALLPIANKEKFPLIQLSEGEIYKTDQMLQLFPDSFALTRMIAQESAREVSSLALVMENFAINKANAETYTKVFKEAGGRSVTSDFIDSDTHDLKSFITKLKTSSAEAVSPFIWNPALMGLFLKQADELKLWETKKLIGNFCFEMQFNEFVKIYPPLAQMDGLLSANMVTTTTKDFSDHFLATYGEPPAQFSDYAYDAIMMLQRCGSDLACLAQPSNGASGEIKFDGNLVRVGSYVLKRLKNGVFVESLTQD